jgi:hypothetical protein
MAQHPYGAKFQYDLDGTPPFTDLTAVKSIGGVDMAVGSSIVTHLESASACAEKIPGWADAGKITVVLFSVKALLNTLYTTLYRTTYYWRVVWPLLTGESNATLFHFQGHWTRLHELEKAANSDEPLLYELEVDITGKPTFTPGT